MCFVLFCFVFAKMSSGINGDDGRRRFVWVFVVFLSFFLSLFLITRERERENEKNNNDDIFILCWGGGLDFFFFFFKNFNFYFSRLNIFSFLWSHLCYNPHRPTTTTTTTIPSHPTNSNQATSFEGHV